MGKLNAKLDLMEVVKAPNIVEMLDDEDIQIIQASVKDGFERDVNSRDKWTENYKEALKLALQVVEQKTEPWTGCANVKFPLVSIAAMQFTARAYPLLVDNNDLVKAKVYGKDPDGALNDAANRIAAHMTWQCMEQMEEWEDEHDTGLTVLAILGTMYKRNVFDTEEKRQSSTMLTPAQFVENYYTKTVPDRAPRGTFIMPLFSNDVRSRVVQGLWTDYDEAGAIIRAQAQPYRTADEVVRDKREGVSPPPLDDATPTTFLEQMCWFDLDGDGYKEPYLAVIEKERGCLRRLSARFGKDSIKYRDKKIYTIEPDPMYTRYKLLPSPDGSCMGIGYGRLLGPINDAVDTAINQMLDAGAMATQGGGFLGRGARIGSGSIRFQPNEWKRVDVVGAALKDNVFPLPVREPSTVLFQLTGLLIQYAERLTSSQELQMGENIGQNTPAATARTMDENGARAFAGAFKRVWRAMRNEFKTQYWINQRFFSQDAAFDELTQGKEPMVRASDYEISSVHISPAADPKVTSSGAKKEAADRLFQVSTKMPNFNRYRSILRWLKAYDTPAIEEVFPPLPQGQADLPPPPDYQGEELKVKQKLAEIKELDVKSALQSKVLELQIKAQKTSAEIMELQAQALKYMSDAKNDAEGNQIALINSAIGAKKQQMDHLLSLVETMMGAKEIFNGTSGISDTGTQAGGQGTVAPASGHAAALASAIGAGR